jgi:hypothetical protein
MAAFKVTVNSDAVRKQLQALQADYQKLPRALARKHVKAAMKRAVRDLHLEGDFRKAAGLHKRTGNLQKSVAITSGFYQQGVEKGRAFARVGYSRKRGKFSEKRGRVVGAKLGYHANILHYGTKPRYQKSGKLNQTSGQHRYLGQGPATLFAAAPLAKAKAAGAPTLGRHLEEALAAATRELPRYLQYRKR